MLMLMGTTVTAVHVVNLLCSQFFVRRLSGSILCLRAVQVCAFVQFKCVPSCSSVCHRAAQGHDMPLHSRDDCPWRQALVRLCGPWCPGWTPAPSRFPGPADGGSLEEHRQPTPQVEVKKWTRWTGDTRMPKDLRGLCSQDPQGRRICYGFNLGTCPSTGDCDNRLHKCCKPLCFGNHSQRHCIK
jgi:hypothetical protein